eukprot:CAMPEP_0184014696 /NCGR_PEP_ID=MMETSP0954-20121128/5845_1 /TAXON_ID=627963 /ORGANISM="Aplanochytrium sp, Strain PBS07" /LENGTH=328 /DNA_ID=CAMNT_0026295291 /DNA_START=28 /DNA_END=1015 /DNA_ORIENTATION=+
MTQIGIQAGISETPKPGGTTLSVKLWRFKQISKAWENQALGYNRVCVLGRETEVVTYRHLDCTLKVWSSEHGSLLQNLHHHNGSGVVTAFAADVNNDVVASGTEDGVINIWEAAFLSKRSEVLSNKSYGFSNFLARGKSPTKLPINNIPSQVIAGCHSSAVLSLDISKDLDTIVSVSRGVLVLNTCKGEFIRTFSVDERTHHVAMTSWGRIVSVKDIQNAEVIETQCSVFSQNGVLLWEVSVKGAFQRMIKSKRKEFMYIATNETLVSLDVEARDMAVLVSDLDKRIIQETARQASSLDKGCLSGALLVEIVENPGVRYVSLSSEEGR